jgi:hypothetical protein
LLLLLWTIIQPPFSTEILEGGGREEAYLRSLLSMLSDCLSFLAYPNVFGIKGIVVVVVVEEEKRPRSMSAQPEATFDVKFTYAANCQIYGYQKQYGDRHAANI